MFLDALICLAVGLFALAGWKRGLILEVGSIAGFFAGLLLASAYWIPVASLLHRYISQETAAAVVAFAAVFALTYLAVALAAGLLRGLVRAFFLGWLDGLCGAAAGVLKGAFIVELALLLLARLPNGPRLFDGSGLAPFFQAQQKPVIGLLLGPFLGALA